jgi:hypothetical protein
MKASSLITSLLFAGAVSGSAFAQAPVGYSYDYRSSPATALGDALRGTSEVIKSSGEAARNGAISAVYAQQAHSQSLRNNYEASKVFWEKRLLWKQKSAELRGTPLTSEQIRAMARDLAPERLSSFQLSPTTNEIRWPAALARPEFDELRLQMEMVFGARTIANSGVGSTSESQITRLAKAMQNDLRLHKDDMPLNEYVFAKNFLRSLVYEARFVPGLEDVAQR